MTVKPPRGVRSWENLAGLCHPHQSPTPGFPTGPRAAPGVLFARMGCRGKGFTGLGREFNLLQLCYLRCVRNKSPCR